ncbi:hypothetical protein [uncultured Brevundimonas sp.]|uniref:hypothetical protein n=1 Tax=Brevundimonas sp. CEF1 TaxID=3442642 RepID=UPI000FA5FC5A|nr:hypothetical protein [uncultured Brevundimonas sp.]
MSKPVWIAIAAGCVFLSGCSVTRYPVLPAWSSDTAQAMDCAGLRQEQDAARRTERQIADIAAGGRAERPQLYSTAKPDADRAVQARLASVEAALKSKNCPA